MTGEFCKGVKNALTPDLRNAAKNQLYDSTVDNVRDPSIFVTYHDAQAYPESARGVLASSSTASRRWREHRVASVVSTRGRGRGADPRTPSTRHNDPRRYMIKFTQLKSSVPNEHPAANKPAHRLYRRNLVLDVD